MEFFDYFARLFGMDPTQLPVYLRIMTFIVPVVFVVFFTCLIISPPPSYIGNKIQRTLGCLFNLLPEYSIFLLR